MREMFWEIYFGHDVSVRPYRLSGWRRGDRTASGDGSVRTIFLGGNRAAALQLHWVTCVFLAVKNINDKQRDKEQG